MEYTEAQKERRRANVRRHYHKTHGVGGLASDDEVLFYGYKEPLTKYAEGFGYRGVLSYSKDMDRVQCHICGQLFSALGRHINVSHGTTARQYKERCGLSQSTALLGEGTRKKYMDVMSLSLEQGLKGNANAQKTLKKLHAEAKEDPELFKKMYPKRSLENKNKFGNCPDQLLDMIDKTRKSFGRTPTAEEFRGFHHGKFFKSIVLTFGSWGNALVRLGLETYSRTHTRTSLVQCLRDFYEVHKRTPNWSDHERGLLPTMPSFKRNFRTINEAKLLANIPLRIRVGKRYEEWRPTDKEREGMIQKMAI